MTDVEFIPVSHSDRIFDVTMGGSAIGFVWRDVDVWHASVISMADRSISAPTRELAADQLCERWSEIVRRN